MSDIDKDLADNYRQLKSERGCTWAQLASEVETHDPAIAAWFREQSDAKAAPRERTEPVLTQPAPAPVKRAPAKPKAPAKKAPAKPKA